MRRVLVSFVLMSCVLSVCRTQRVLADGDCFSNKELQRAFNQGSAAEKSGRMIDAFEAYGTGRSKFSCEGNNAVAAEAEAGWKRVGKRQGDEQERRGRLYSGRAIYSGTLATGAGGPAPNKDAQDAGAFEWFEASENFADADRVMVELARSKPESLETFEIVRGHFQQRKGNAESLKKYFNYAVAPGEQADLEVMASENGMAALEREDKAFNRKEFNPLTDKMMPVEASMSDLKVARQWFSQFNDPKGAKVIERARKRGDGLFQDDQEPRSLQEAMGYYELAKDSEKMSATRAKADRLGDAETQKGELMKAINYYQIAGDSDKQKALTARLKTDTEQQKDGIINSDKKKEQFKKDQENLEKELGF